MCKKLHGQVLKSLKPKWFRKITQNQKKKRSGHAQARILYFDQDCRHGLGLENPRRVLICICE